MSTEKTVEEAWAVQMAYHEQRGTKPPTELDPETEAILREIMGDEAVDEAIAEDARRAAVEGT